MFTPSFAGRLPILAVEMSPAPVNNEPDREEINQVNDNTDGPPLDVLIDSSDNDSLDEDIPNLDQSHEPEELLGYQLLPQDLEHAYCNEFSDRKSVV